MNEDLVFNLEQPLIISADNNYQNRGNFKFVVDRESLDWYNARLSMDFKLTKLTGRNVIINDKIGIINSASSFEKKKLVLVLMHERFINVILPIML